MCKVSKESGCRRRDEQHYLILFGGESSRSNIISAKRLLPDPHHHCQQDSIPYPSHIDSTNPVHLSSVNKQSYQTQMIPCGYILSACL